MAKRAVNEEEDWLVTSNSHSRQAFQSSTFNLGYLFKIRDVLAPLPRRSPYHEWCHQTLAPFFHRPGALVCVCPVCRCRPLGASATPWKEDNESMRRVGRRRGAGQQLIKEDRETGKGKNHWQKALCSSIWSLFANQIA